MCGRSANAMEPLPGTEPPVDTRSLAMADAQRAFSANTAGVYLNPAIMSMAAVYHVNVKYQFTGKDNLHNAGVVFLDSITSSRIAAGASLDYRRDSRANSYFESWDARLALSTGIANKFFIGLTGRYLRAAHDITSGTFGPNRRPALERSSNIQANGFTFDAGIAARLGKYVIFGLAGYNLTKTDTVFAPICLGGGFSFLIKRIWLVETDALADFTSYEGVGARLAFGTELLIKEVFAIRAGYSHEFFMHINQVSAGLGYTWKRAALDLGYRQDIEFPGRFRLALGLRIFVG